MITRRQLVLMLGAGTFATPLAFSAQQQRTKVDAKGSRSGLPSWVPAPGTRAIVSLDLPKDADPCPSPKVCDYTFVEGIHGIIGDGGGIWMNPYLGTLGSLLYHGGGHASYAGNLIMRYDIETRVHSRVTKPWTPVFHPASGWELGDPVWYESWADNTFTTTVLGQPAVTHFYDVVVILPPGMGGAGPQGALLRPMSPAAAPGGHIFDFASPGWKRFALAPRQGYGTCTLAAPRHKVYAAVSNAAAAGTLLVLDLDAKAWSELPLTGGQWQRGVLMNYYGNLRYMEAHDLLFYFRRYGISINGGEYDFWVVDPNTGRVYYPGITGDAITESNATGGGDWAEELGCYAWYAGQGGDNVYRITPPASPTSQPWTCIREVITGPTPVSIYTNGGVKLFSHFKWNPKIKCFLFVGDTGKPVQAWRLRGT